MSVTVKLIDDCEHCVVETIDQSQLQSQRRCVKSKFDKKHKVVYTFSEFDQRFLVNLMLEKQ